MSGGGSFGRIAFGVIGAVIGSYFGSPGLGYALGSAIGGLVFPVQLPEAQGPRLGPDSGVTGAQIGTVLPIIYGTAPCNGIVVRAHPRVEIARTEKVGGKGGPTQKVTTYTYTRTYAVMLCEGGSASGKAGLLRIWRNSKLVYDVRPQQDWESLSDYVARKAVTEGFASKFTFYSGSTDQLPDPTLEAETGVGNQPAYRGRAYVVFVDEDVTDNGGRPSIWRFEVVSNGAFGEASDVQYAAQTVGPWQSGTTLPMAPFGLYRYRFSDQAPTRESGDATGVGAWRTTLAAAIADAEAINGYTVSSSPLGWHKGSGALDRVTLSPYENVDPGDELSLFIHYNQETTDKLNRVDKVGSSNVCNIVAGAETKVPILTGIPFWFTGLDADGTGSVGTDNLAGRYTLHDRSTGTYLPALPTQPELDAFNNCTGGFGTPALLGGAGGASFIADITIEVQRLPTCSPSPCTGQPVFPENPDYCVIGDEVVRDIGFSAVTVVGGFKVLQDYADNGSVVTSYPQGPAMPVGSENDNEEYWTASYDALVASGQMEAGKVFNSSGTGDPELTYPILVDTVCQKNRTTLEGSSVGVTLESIVQSAAARVNIPQGDLLTSELSELVLGYIIERRSSVRQIIDPLRSYGFFDAVDTGGRISFPLRGKAPVITLGPDNYGAHDIQNGERAPAPFKKLEKNEVEIPRAVQVRYLMPHADYAIGKQDDGRAVVDSDGSQLIDVPISMTDDKARQIAQVLLSELWLARVSYDALNLLPELLRVEPADSVLVPRASGGGHDQVRITEMSRGHPGFLACKGVRDDPSAYISTAAGLASGIPPGMISVVGNTVFSLIDSAALDNNDDDAGFYIAAYGPFSGWAGAGLYESVDNGENYDFVKAFPDASTYGTLTAPLSSGTRHIIDTTSVLYVTLSSGTLESRTQDAVLNGANALFVGADGRWEIVQFLTATLVGTQVYELTNLLRGRRGTEHAIGSSQAGDKVILCETCLRLHSNDSALNTTRLYKMVSSAALLESANAVSQTLNGTALRCYAPAQVRATRDAAGDLSLTIVRRSRLGAEFLDYVDVPLNEALESYQIDILNGAAGSVVRTISTNTPEFTYTAAQQIADFGRVKTTNTIHATAYQLSALTGRGYPLEVIL